MNQVVSIYFPRRQVVIVAVHASDAEKGEDEKGDDSQERKGEKKRADSHVLIWEKVETGKGGDSHV